MKRKNFPAEQFPYDGADGGIPAEEAISQYQSKQVERMLNEAHLRQCANTFMKKGGGIL